MSSNNRGRRGQRGQSLVLFAAGLAAMIGMLGVILDGGYLWGQQRVVQNGSDASAEAGALVLAQKLAGAAAPVGGWDAAVNSKIQASAATNGITISAAYYTDMCGIPLEPDGTAALNGDGTYNLSAAAPVGGGSLPASAGTVPDCPSLTVGPPQGVLVYGQKSVGTFFMQAFGLTTVGVNTTSTAVSGWRSSICDASEGEACALLPITVSTTPFLCANNGEVTADPVNTAWINGPTYRIPLCKNTAGNVGWIDWTPPGGGSSEVVQEILHPNNPPIDLPSWQYVSQAGNPNSANIENAINTYSGQVVLIPLFDVTCATTPNFSQVAVPTSYGCSNLGGHGQNNWYRFPAFAAFRLCSAANPLCTIGGVTYSQGAYTNGSNGTFCGTAWSGAGCLVGQFVNMISVGPVSATGGGGTGTSKFVGVQLIK